MDRTGDRLARATASRWFGHHADTAREGLWFCHYNSASDITRASPSTGQEVLLRQNFQSSPMEDYEIRDTLRRATTPILQVMLSIGTNNTARMQFVPHQEISRPLTLSVLVTNRSPQPAYHAVVYLGLDVDFRVPVNVGFDQAGPPTGHGADEKIWFVKRFTSPPDLPIFQEATLNPLGVNFSIATKFIDSSYFDITTIVQAPGYASTDYWAIACNSGLLKLYGPNDPNWMPTK
jgi:hypothetical protein